MTNVGGCICTFPMTYDSNSAQEEFEFPSNNVDGALELCIEDVEFFCKLHRAEEAFNNLLWVLCALEGVT